MNKIEIVLEWLEAPDNGGGLAIAFKNTETVEPVHPVEIMFKEAIKQFVFQFAKELAEGSGPE